MEVSGHLNLIVLVLGLLDLAGSVLEHLDLVALVICLQKNE